MSKKMLLKTSIALVFVAVAVIWLLCELEVIPNFNGRWLIAGFCCALGLIFIIRGIVMKNVNAVKKFNILFGAGFLIGAVCALVGVFFPSHIVWPLIAVIITVAILICIVAVGGKSWDEGDNQKVGYKNYYQRKAEKEKEEANK